MPDADKLHDIARSLRALQIRAVEADSMPAQAFLMMAAKAVHDMAVEAEQEQQPPARTVAEMMKRLGNRG